MRLRLLPWALWLAGSLASWPSLAQTPADPGLHRRSAQAPDAVPEPVIATGHTNLPPEAEGRYRWGRSGGRPVDEIELYFEEGKLQGYLVERLDPSPHTAPVNFAFATTHVDGNAVAWTTRRVHGKFYSFSGHLERGLVASPTLPGYYLLTGTLTEHGGDADSVGSTVSLKREPGNP